MPTPILATKLYIPPARPKAVRRPHLIAWLNEGLQRKLTLISAPAGFGKTTLVSEWIQTYGQGDKETGRQRATSPATLFVPLSPPLAVAWLSLDAGDNDPARFLAYLVAALQTIAPQLGGWVVAALQSPQPPPTEVMLTVLLNEMTTLTEPFVLVLDDYHVIEAKAVDQALTFLLDHLPPQLHLVIATREDPNLPLARLRAGGQLCEVRVNELRFSRAEAADFLNQVMALKLSAAEIAALETRTEGWVAGLQLAAISMQGQQDTSSFLQSFTGSHRFVMDYLVEEVLQQQPPQIQTFLLRTAILERLCGPLCEAVLLDCSTAGQATLEYLEQANLFIVPLDNQRRWYRYHQLFAELLRQRLHQPIDSSIKDVQSSVNELHIRASQWYEENGLELEAFHHATAANDIARAERLIEGNGIPLHLRGAVITILNWLASLPTSILNARPWLWWRHASLLLVNGHTTGVAEKLHAAETALQSTELDERLGDKTRNFVGRIATARAVLALTRYDAETMLVQSRRALEYLDANNLSTRANANWTLGYAYFLQGERTAASQSYTEAIALGQAAGDTFSTILATISLGNVQAAENQLHLAAEHYRHVLQVAGDQPLQIISEAHLGLAHILYEWNDLDGAAQHGRQSLHLAQQYDRVIDRFIVCELFLARLQLAQGDVAGASALVAQAEQSARQKNFVHRIPEVVDAQVLVLLRQGKLTVAAGLAQTYDLPISQARVQLAQGNAAAALALLGPLRQQLETKLWVDEQLKVMVLQAVALHAHGEKDKAVQLLGEALALAEPAGFIRLFVDEGAPLAQLLSAAAARGGAPAYIGKLLAAFPNVVAIPATRSAMVEPLSQREVEVLHLIAQGLSNHEICERLFLALDTVKGHNRRIFDKLQVQRRTEAIARARTLGLL